MRRWLVVLLGCLAVDCGSFGSGEPSPEPPVRLPPECVLDAPDGRLDECKLAP